MDEFDRLKAALHQAYEDIVYAAYNEGISRDGLFDHSCMADARWLFRACGGEVGQRTMDHELLKSKMELLPAAMVEAVLVGKSPYSVEV